MLAEFAAIHTNDGQRPRFARSKVTSDTGTRNGGTHIWTRNAWIAIIIANLGKMYDRLAPNVGHPGDKGNGGNAVRRWRLGRANCLFLIACHDSNEQRTKHDL